MEKLLSIGEVAKTFMVSYDAVRWWDKEGKLNSVRINGKRFFYRTDVLKFKEIRDFPEYIRQELLCRKCGCKHGTRPIKKRPNSKSSRTLGTCESCISESKERLSKRMQEANPMKNKCVVDRVSKSLKLYFEENNVVHSLQSKKKIQASLKEFWDSEKANQLKERFSNRMKEDNPMFHSSVRNSVSKTLKERYANGEISIPKGDKHWLWKGNRSFNLYVRSKLYKQWTIEVLKRDSFTCNNCGVVGGLLHVHHVRPLRDIIADVLLVEGLESISVSSLKGKWDALANEVVSSHSIDDGITLCPKCHGILDEKYRRKHENS